MFSHHHRRKPTQEHTKNSFDRQTCNRDETENLKRPYNNDRGNAFDGIEGEVADGSRVKLGWCITYCSIRGGWGGGGGGFPPRFEQLCKKNKYFTNNGINP
jgi:hypothetical protein